MLTTSILNPKDLFQKSIRYTIPEFQRRYVWTQDDQWEPLWQDVRNVAEGYLEELERTGGDRVKAEERTKGHFLGALVLQQVPTAARDIEQREVIDGQQRVTTLQLLLDAIQQVCEERGLKPTAKRLSKLVMNDEDLIGDTSHHVFKLWPTRIDRDAFRHAMDDGLAISDFEESLIVIAHEFFQDAVNSWLEEAVASEDDSLDALETAVTAMLQMVVIDLDAEDDPNIIFETLNARGTPLEQSDLIKNFVLSRFSEESDQAEGIWGDLDDEWWRDTVRQGRLYRPRLDMLFNYWLAMRTGEEVPPSKVFDVFRDHASKQRISTLMLDVKRDLENYRNYDCDSRTPEEDRFHYRAGVMQAGAITPILLHLLSEKLEIRIRCLHALESFLIRRMICRQTAKDYNHLALELVSRIREGHSNSADTVVISFFKEQDVYSREWPTDDAVADSLETTPVYRLLSRGRLRLVLEGIESRLRSQKSEQLDVPKGLTIEHLMPKSWGRYWPLPNGADEESGTEARNRIVHTIGNLTLVNQKLNSAVSNSPWECKRTELLKHSVMTLNKELSDFPEWDEDTIRSRSRRMARLIAQCWPGPHSDEWD